MISSGPALAYLKTTEKTHALTNKVNLVGRAPSTHIVLTHPSISKEHAAIDIANENEVYIRDLNSLNACYVNGERLQKGSSFKLNPGDQVQFGKEPTIFTFEKAASGSRSPSLQNNRPVTAPIPDEVSQAVGLKGVKDKKISVTEIVGANATRDDNPISKALSRPIQEARSPGSIKSPLTPPVNQQQDVFEQQMGQISANRQQPQAQTNQAQQVQLMASQQRELEEKMELYEKRYQETYERVIELNSKILEKEEQLLRREGDLKYQTNEIEGLKDELEKQKAKLTALELYSTDLQRKLDQTQLEVTEKTRYIDEVANNDWVKKIHEMNSEIEALRAAIVQKEDELISLKKQNNALIQGQKTANPAYHAAFLEQQGKELALAKRQLAEYENRASVCNKRWTSLIKENMDKEEVIKGLKLQLNRQLDNYKALQKEFDSKINEMNMKFLSLIDPQNNQKQYEAGLFLVDQMKGIQEDRTQILLENESLHSQMQQFIEEINALKSDNERYELLLGRNSDNLDLGDTSPSVLTKLKKRIEELEDYVEELKSKEGVPKVVEMQQMFENLEFEIAKLRREKDELRAKISGIQKGTSDDRSSIEFFSKLLQERDGTIAALKEQIAGLGKRERENYNQIESFQRQLGNANNQIESYQTKQRAFNDMFNTRKSFDINNPSNIIENENLISNL